MSEKACPSCRILTKEAACPKCKSPLSDDFSGLLIVFDYEGSVIARAMGIKENGRYALKVR